MEMIFKDIKVVIQEVQAKCIKKEDENMKWVSINVISSLILTLIIYL